MNTDELLTICDRHGALWAKMTHGGRIRSASIKKEFEKSFAKILEEYGLTIAGWIKELRRMKIEEAQQDHKGGASMSKKKDKIAIGSHVLIKANCRGQSVWAPAVATYKNLSSWMININPNFRGMESGTFVQLKDKTWRFPHPFIVTHFLNVLSTPHYRPFFRGTVPAGKESLGGV